MCDAFVDAIDGGAGAGLLEIFTSGFATKLATLTFSDPAYAAAAAGVAEENAIADDVSADTTGTANRCRVTTSTPLTMFEGTVDTAGQEPIRSGIDCQRAVGPCRHYEYSQN